MTKKKATKKDLLDDLTQIRDEKRKNLILFTLKPGLFVCKSIFRPNPIFCGNSKGCFGLAEDLKLTYDKVYTIGDAKSPRRVLYNTSEGFEVANQN